MPLRNDRKGLEEGEGMGKYSSSTTWNGNFLRRCDSSASRREGTNADPKEGCREREIV